MRGSSHEHQLFQLSVQDGDVRVGEPFERLTGALTGRAVALPATS
jgi:hypothetical protein